MPTLTYPETNITHPEEHYYILAQLQGSHHFLVDIRHENKNHHKTLIPHLYFHRFRFSL